MGVSQASYRDMLRRLLPDGPAWPQESSELSMQILTALGQTYLAVHQAAEQLHEEADPRSTVAMLDDWERNFGLPDNCVGDSQSLESRRNALVVRVTSRGSPTRDYFIGLARTLGIDVSLVEHRPLRCGMGRCGERLCSREMSFVWQVVEEDPTSMEDIPDVDAVLESRAALECVISRLRPAHTSVRFHYVDYLVDENATQFIGTEDGVGLTLEMFGLEYASN